MTSLKISRIKPSDIQQLLFEIDDEIAKYTTLKSDRYSLFNPLFEEIIFEHKFLEPKLFVT